MRAVEKLHTPLKASVGCDILDVSQISITRDIGTMATSFRIPPDKMARLELLAKRLHKSKAQVVMQAIDKYYELEMSRSEKSLADVALELGFTPISGDLGDLAADEERQRKIISEKLSRKGRN